MKENSENQLFLMNKWEISGNKAYFCANEKPILFETDFINKNISILKEISLNGSGSWSCCKKVEDFLILFSDWGNEIAKYNLKNGEQLKITIEGASTLGIFDAFLINYDLYAVSIRQGKIFIIDTLNFNIKKEINLIDEESETPNFAQSIYDDGKIYICLGSLYGIVSYDVRTEEIINYIGDFIDYKNVYTIAKYNKYIFLGGINKGIIYKCEIKGEKIVEKDKYYVYLNVINENFSMFHRMEIIRNKLVVIQNFNDEIQLIDCDVEGKIMTLIPDKQFRTSIPNDLSEPRYMYMYTRENRYLGLLDCWKKNIIEFDIIEKKFKKKYYFIKSEDKREITKGVSFRREKTIWDLQEFLDVISDKLEVK